MLSHISQFLEIWPPMRLLRLSVGGYFAFEAFVTKDGFTGLLAGTLLFQAITNTGCCGAQGCAPARTPSQTGSFDESQVEFEEVQSTR